MVMAPSAALTDEIYVNNNHYPDNLVKETPVTPAHHGGLELSRSKLASKDLIFDLLKERVSKIDVNTCLPGEEDAFYVADLGQVYRQHLRWKMNLGRVKPFFGKCVRGHVDE